MTSPISADVRASASAFVALAVFQDAPKELTGDGKPERVDSSEISKDLFPLLGVHPLYGRSFTSSDMQADTHVAILSYPLWPERFGGDPNVIGKGTLEGQLYSIVGVMPAQRSRGIASVGPDKDCPVKVTTLFTLSLEDWPFVIAFSANRPLPRENSNRSLSQPS